MARRIEEIIVHCSATEAGMDIGVDEIRTWHLARGWKDIGYHYVIRRDGRLEQGRPETTAGAHVKGRNAKSLGVCLVGGVRDGAPDCNYTSEQWYTLEILVKRFDRDHPGATVLGHRDVDGVDKACPCFDVRAWWYG